MLLPPHLLPAVFLGLETGTEVEVGTPASPAEGLSPRCQQEGVPVQGAAVWMGVCFLSFPCVLHLAPSLLALTPVFLQHQSSAACTSLMGKDKQDGKAGRGDALGRGQACPGQRGG